MSWFLWVGGATAIIPSIDVVGCRAVQLIGGEAEAIDAGDPIPILEKFSLAGRVAVIDIYAARGEGSNQDAIRDLCLWAPIRVGRGIRDAETAPRLTRHRCGQGDRFTVKQNKGFCHLGSRTCWGEDHGIGRLDRRLVDIISRETSGNTTKPSKDPDLLVSKLIEEASELAAATSREEVIGEAADLLYFALVKATTAGISVEEISKELDRRAMRVSRRPMTATTEKQ